METRGMAEEIWWRDVASHPGFTLITAVSLLQGPCGPALRGKRWRGHGGGREEGRRGRE